MVGRLLSYWDDPFSGAMLNFGGVFFSGKNRVQPPVKKGLQWQWMITLPRWCLWLGSKDRNKMCSLRWKLKMWGLVGPLENGPQMLNGTGLFTYIWVVLGVNVGKYTRHWASGLLFSFPCVKPLGVFLHLFTYCDFFTKNSQKKNLLKKKQVATWLLG